ncbi:hypothetical protein D9758_013983 [Tetrapyrgos nigripes]|uniref:Retrovirus-related Pol polyprotein from transposon TNT 1-94-like beta-barrel domain-containing protein n=1 Tax=Tetrapyrgos nigripes TaxID=182062 RepID=A0A8H5G7W3_9AGAR|nr:hypothetical protein D9758_013983 [Tetrapyrgos nigripes]
MSSNNAINNTESIFNVPILNTTNYEFWNYAITRLLEAKGLSRVASVSNEAFNALTESEQSSYNQIVDTFAHEWDQYQILVNKHDQELVETYKLHSSWDDKDEQALGFISSYLLNDVGLEMREFTRDEIEEDPCAKAKGDYTAKMLWDKIDKKYSSPGPTSWFLDFKEFMSWTLDEKKDPANQIASLGAVLTHLKAYGFTVDDKFRALFLMDRIPQSWGNYAQFTLATIEPKNLTMAHVEGLILVEYKRRTGQSSESSLLTRITGDRRKFDSAPNWNNQKAGSSKQKNQDKGKGKQPKPQEPSKTVTIGDANQGGDKKKKTRRSKKKKGSKKGAANLANPEVEADSDSDDDAPLMVTAFMANPFMNATLDPIEISDTDDLPKTCEQPIYELLPYHNFLIVRSDCFIDENNDSSLKERVKRNLAKQVRPQTISGYFILTHYERPMINELAQETVDFESFLRVEAHHQMTCKLAGIWDYTYNSDGTHTEPYLRAKEDLNGDEDLTNQWFDHEGTIRPIQKQIEEEVEYFCRYIMNKALADMRNHKWIPQQFKKREPVPSKPPSLIERAYWPTPAQSVMRTNGVTINTQFHDTSLYPDFIRTLPFNHTKASSSSSSRKRKAVRGSSSSESSDSTSSDHSEESSFKYIPLSVAFKMWQDRMSHMFTDPILENMKKEPDEFGNTSKKPRYDVPLEEEAGPSSLADAINVSISSGYLADDDGVSLGSESDVEIYIDGDETMAFWQVFHTSNKNSALIQLPQIPMSSDYCESHTALAAIDNCTIITNDVPVFICEQNFVARAHCSTCEKYPLNSICKSKITDEITYWVSDSSASTHITNNLMDFAQYHKLPNPIPLQIADKRSQTYLEGVGTVFIEHINEEGVKHTIKLYPVFYQPTCTHRLLSRGCILREGYYEISRDGNPQALFIEKWFPRVLSSETEESDKSTKPVQPSELMCSLHKQGTNNLPPDPVVPLDLDDLFRDQFDDQGPPSDEGNGDHQIIDDGNGSDASSENHNPGAHQPSDPNDSETESTQSRELTPPPAPEPPAQVPADPVPVQGPQPVNPRNVDLTTGRFINRVPNPNQTRSSDRQSRPNWRITDPNMQHSRDIPRGGWTRIQLHQLLKSEKRVTMKINLKQYQDLVEKLQSFLNKMF